MENKPNTDTSNTDPMERIADSLERLCRIQFKLVEEVIELRRQVGSLGTSYAEVHHLV